MRKALFGLAAIGLVWLVGMGGAGAVDYPATAGPLTVSGTGSVNPGGTLTVSGTGFAPGATIQITIASTPTLLGTVNANGAGSFSTTVTIPASIDPGVHTLSATGASPNGGTLTLAATITVQGGPLLGLPLTGANIAALVGVGVAAITVGALFVRVTRRRSATTT